jgi:uncharacterized membrane protein YeaQ/YmgE (transglycosylase-associated protein family)
MDIIYWTLMIGFITGAATRYIFRKMRLGDLSMAMISGLAGSVIGGYLGSLTGLYKYGDMKGLYASVLGALICVGIYTYTRKATPSKKL